MMIDESLQIYIRDRTILGFSEISLINLPKSLIFPGKENGLPGIANLDFHWSSGCFS